MANLIGAYAVEDEAKLDGFRTLEAGRYAVKITKTEKKASKKGNGDYLPLALQVVEGKDAGSFLYVNLNLWNKEENVRAMARNEFAAIRQAVGVASPKDSEELCNIRFFVEVGLRKDKNTGEMVNRIREYIGRNAEGKGKSEKATGDAPPCARNAPPPRPTPAEDIPF